MTKRKGFYLADTELELCGPELKVGDVAPTFNVVNAELEPFDSAKKFEGKTVLIAAVPSLDTGVCSVETKRFDEEAQKIADKVKVYIISADLPFAQQRFEVHEDIDEVTFISDYKDLEFGNKFGCAIDGLRLLNRSVFVIDREGKLAYVEYVEQNTSEPQYEAALEAALKAAE